jgi:hypothetical protein
MSTKYSSKATSGYNATPPADDGTEVEANKVKWSTIKEKLSDVLKTFGEAINSALVTHFDNGPTAISSNTTLAASHYGQLIEVTSNPVLTLTDASTLTAGWWCEIRNNGTSNATMDRATASDTIDGVSSSITIYPLDTFKIIVKAAADGFLTQYSNQQTQKWRKGVDLTTSDVSAGILTVGTDGNYFDFTGTDTISGIATVGVGTVIKIHFDAAAPLTHDGTNFSLLGGKSVTTEAGDELEFIEYASADWRCTSYSRFSGKTIASGGWYLLETQSVSAASEMDFTVGIDSTYATYIIVIDELTVANDGARLQFQVSPDGGSTFDADASAYRYTTQASNDAATPLVSNFGDPAEAYISLTNNQTGWHVGNASEEKLRGKIWIYRPSDADYLYVDYNMTYLSEAATPTLIRCNGAGRHEVAEVIDAFRIVPNGGNITATAKLYGITI